MASEPEEKALDKECILKTMRPKRHYEKPSEKKKRLKYSRKKPRFKAPGSPAHPAGTPGQATPPDQSRACISLQDVIEI